MGLLGLCFGVGFILGPAIGGPLAAFGIHVPFLVAAGLAAANLIFAAAVLVEPERHVDASERAESRPRRSVLANPAVLRLCLVYWVFSMAVTQLETVFAYYMKDTFQWKATELWVIYVAMALVMGGVQGGALRPLAARFPERRLIAAGIGILAVAFLLLPVAPTVALLCGPLALAAIGRGVAQPSLMSLASMEAEHGERGAVMGTFQSSASLARVFGPLIGGAVYDLAHAGPFWMAGVLLIAAGLLPLSDRAAVAEPTPPADTGR